MNKLNFILFILMIFSGCSQKAPSSNVKISLAAVTGSAKFPGGLMITGSGPNGKKFVRKVGASDELEIILPNGVWSFGVVGWKNTTNVFEGEPHCDFSTNKNLDGGDIDLVFNTAQAKCTNMIFGGKMHSTNINEFISLRFNTCLSIKHHILEEGASAVPVGTECGTFDEPMNGGAQSFQIIVGERLLDGSVVSAGLTSSCVNVSGSRANSNIKIPYGSSVFQMPYFVKSYSATSCTGSETVHDFKLGFKTPAVGNSGAVTPNTGDNKLDIYLHTEACNPSQITAADMGAGDPGSGGPYLICKKEHFENIGSAGPVFEASATYIIGKDIDFGGSNITVSADFSGSIDGGGFTLSNGDSPLFQTVKIPDGAQDSYIHDFKIDNFGVIVTGATNAGVLAETIGLDDPWVNNRIEISRLKITNSSVSSTNTSSTGKVGGLVGWVNLSTASGGNAQLFMREIEARIDVVNNTTNAGGYTGGLIGVAEGPNQGAGTFSLEKTLVGVNPANLKDPSERNTIIGHTSVGGIAGRLKNIEIRDEVFIYSSLDGVSDIGGIAGSSDNDTNVENTYVNTTIATTVAEGLAVTINNVGGIIGKVIETSNVNIGGVVSDFVVSDTPAPVNQLGGFVGELSTAGSNANLFIRNSRAFIETHTTGNNQGGMIGKFAPNAAGGETIVGSVVRGVLGNYSLDVANPNNIRRGGFAGYANHLKVQRSIVEDIIIEGYELLGGGFGYASGESDIHEAEVKVSITAHKISAGGLYVGGLVGSNDVDDSANRLRTIRLEADIDLVKSTTDCSSGDYCGIILGENSNAGSNGFNGIIWEGSIEEDIYGTATPVTEPICGDSTVNCTSGTNFSDVYQTFDSINCGSLTGATYPFIYDVNDSECRSLFESRWRQYGYEIDPDTSVERYLAGGSIEPFKINSVTQWNDIGDDAFLMGKTFKLTSDLDFSGLTLIPLSSQTNPFQGKLIANGKKLIGITTDDYVIAATNNSAEIGSRDDQLKVDGLNLSCYLDGCGFIGNSMGGRFSVVLKNMNVIEGAGSVVGVGGLIGIITSPSSEAHVSIENSGFQGEMNLSSSTEVGGLVGYIEFSANLTNLSISNSFSRPTTIYANNYVGGLVGRSESYDTLVIEDTLIQINEDSAATLPFGSTAVAGKSGGFVGKATSTSSTIVESIIDYSAATLSGDLVCVQNGGGFLANPSNKIYEIYSPIGSDIGDGVTYGAHSPHAGTANFINTSGVSFGGDKQLKLINGKVRLSWE